jgi:MFS family permease
VLVSAGVMLGVYGIVQVEEEGMMSICALGPIVAAELVLAASVVRQQVTRDPLMPLRIFSSRAVTGANVVLLVMYVGTIGLLFLGPLYLLRVLDYSAIATGLALAPMPVVIGAISIRPSPWLQARYGQRTVLLASLAMQAVGLALLVRLPDTSHYVTSFLPTLVISGAGFGLAVSTLTAMNMGGAAPQDAGLASGLFNTTRQIGMAVGVSMSATLASSATSRLADDGHDAASALVGGYHIAFGVGAALMVVALGLTAAVLRAPRRPASTGGTEQLAVAEAA